MGLGEFAIDQRIVKSDPGGICVGVGKINAGEACPINCPQTHGTRLTRGVDLAAFQIENAKLPAGFANGKHFRVRGRIIGGSDLVRGFGNNSAVSYDDRTEGSATSGEDVVHGELNGASHERIVHVFALSMRNRQRFAGGSKPRTRKSVDMDSFAAASLRSEYMPRVRNS